MLRAFLHVKKPEAEGSYVLLASSVAWKRLRLSAQWANPVVTDVDLAERIKAVSDILVPADAVFITFTKVVQDQITFLDSISYTGELGRSEALSLSENTIFVVSKEESDSIEVIDAPSLFVTKIIEDIISMSDEQGISFGPIGASDSTPLSDVLSFSLQKYLEDTYTLSDTLSYVAVRSASDSVSISDDLTVVFVYGRTSILNGFALNEASLND